MTARKTSLGTRERLAESHWAINTTVRCQHRCVYCFEGDRKGMRNLLFEEAAELIEKASRRVGKIVFMGAEPTLNPDIAALTSLAVSVGLKVGFSTNGLKLADMGFLEECRRAGLGELEISFPYPDAEVYQAITRAAHKGFYRLLAALENIERLNRDESRANESALGVNLNVVVSKLNASRLDEVCALASDRFEKTPHIFTMKAIKCPAGKEEWFERNAHVCAEDLRDAFMSLANGSSSGLPIIYRGFPLCVLPDPPGLDADMEYRLGRSEVAFNFTDQKRFDDMRTSDTPYDSQSWSELCCDCSLKVFCFRRDLFSVGDPDGRNRPVPWREPLSDELASLLEKTTGSPE